MTAHPPGERTGRPTRRRPVFIEICCSPQSVLVSSLPRRIDGIRITEKDDFTRRATVDFCIKHIGSEQDVIWFSAPCTGGCPYQSINRMRGEDTRNNIEGHWTLMKRLWRSFEAVAEHAILKKATIVIEWPRRCHYWNFRKVERFATRHSLLDGFVDGCMVGITSEDPKTYGVPLHKPWRLRTNRRDFCERITRECDGSHEHARTEGRDTKRTELYTHAFAKHVMRSLYQTRHS